MTPIQEQLDGIGERDESAEFRIFGPPGTGKTTYSSKQIAKAVAKYGPDSVLVTSFSRAAASELVARDLPVARDRVGTLHAHCYRALGRPTIAETKAADWNKSAKSEYWISGGTDSDLDEPSADRMVSKAEGDLLLAQASCCRNKLWPVELWPQDAVAFNKKWTEWKQANGLLDFTDLLERAAQDIRIAPGNPSVIFADEAQDFTPLQLKIVRGWGNHASFYVIVGDDDQCIYGFTGATPEAFITPDIPADRKIVLSQSYRVPRTVHALADRWIKGVSAREPKEYRPTENEGAVIRADRHDHWRNPNTFLNDAERRIAKGQTCMFLGACSYMLQSIRAGLIERGIPFHNPYRRNRGDWNPLLSTPKKMSAADRVIALLQPHDIMGEEARPWNGKEFRAFAEWMEASENFNRGAKAAFKLLAEHDEITEEQLEGWFNRTEYAALASLLTGPVRQFLDWWLRRVNKEHARTAGFPCHIAARRGLSAIRDTPRVILGTIHSVKGGEADVVYLFPDLSMPGQKEWFGGNEFLRDPIRRQFYVGMTRARDTLVLGGYVDEKNVGL